MSFEVWQKSTLAHVRPQSVRKTVTDFVDSAVSQFAIDLLKLESPMYATIDADGVFGRDRLDSACFPVYQTHGLRRIGHLDPLFLEALLDLEINLFEACQVFRVIEVSAPVRDIENQR